LFVHTPPSTLDFLPGRLLRNLLCSSSPSCYVSLWGARCWSGFMDPWGWPDTLFSRWLLPGFRPSERIRHQHCL
jgi:hypothetical protein